MHTLAGSGEAAEAFGVSITTMRRWERDGKMTAERTPGGLRRYDLSVLEPERFHSEKQGVADTQP